MSHVGYVAAGWLSTVGVLTVFAYRSMRRGRALARQVPPEERRWT